MSTTGAAGASAGAFVAFGVALPMTFSIIAWRSFLDFSSAFPVYIFARLCPRLFPGDKVLGDKVLGNSPLAICLAI